MAKVTTPQDTFKSYQTIGRSVTLRKIGNTYAVNKKTNPIRKSATSQQLIEENSEAINGEWELLTTVQKLQWESDGEEVSITGYQLFNQEGFKALLQSICGVAKCGQNVCILT